MEFKDGDKISVFTIYGYVEGELSMDNGLGMFILHNEPKCNGHRAKEMRGYSYSWFLGNINNPKEGGDWRDLCLLGDIPSYHGSMLKFKMK